MGLWFNVLIFPCIGQWEEFQDSGVKEVAEVKEVKETKEVKDTKAEAQECKPLRFKDIPLTPETVEKIKRTMAKINMKPPAWAEKYWMFFR